ncbi:anaerobic glycerol-3-phosphate dehydrogenase subunit C [Halapricum sp. CBA1109]|uniref:anaerobic glycerol-3-phosphate dehydrogenase subunit C n=1 Tax=Halapricum sp. CBA1109 TaxID=2668068 RepID=UPI0012F72F34|nr:anaerobic glycerol-3-phosphate dehydrogenase subunit C [Halapricum sp. CBA1109]MUV89603.1 anaerobic glycerol-3-phosphate dehydrogenase subunit C [Halapricum sp. CBA1109]
MSDAEDPTTFSPAEPTTGEEFEPVEVFPDNDDFDLRPGADNCYKCSTCDTNCPVAEVDDDFPGPKFQGPEQWRLTQTDDDYEIDDSITSCSNCLRCDNACPSGVPLSQMHNTARGRYVDEQMSKLSVEYIRNRILANYRTSAWLASKVPRLSTFVMNNSAVRWVMDKTMGIPKERDFPAFATETFQEWWAKRGGADESRRRARQNRPDDADPSDYKVAYFHGCYSNYNTTQVGKAMVRVYEELGFEVVVPEQKCSGTPMFANGMLDDAERHAKVNVSSMSDLVEQGYDAIASCTSCSMALRQEYPELFDIDGIEKVSENTYDSVEYLRIHTDIADRLSEATVEGDLAEEFAYHAPCHGRNQGLERQAVELFAELDGVGIEDVGDSCSGISGTYGWKSEKYEISMEIGQPMFDHMEDSAGETGMTECPTCAMQMEHGTGYDVRHPLELIEAAIVEA